MHVARATIDLEMYMLFCCLHFPLEEKKIEKGEKKNSVSQNFQSSMAPQIKNDKPDSL